MSGEFAPVLVVLGTGHLADDVVRLEKQSTVRGCYCNLVTVRSIVIDLFLRLPLFLEKSSLSATTSTRRDPKLLSF